MEIGKKLKQFRLMQKLTLAELASRSELSKGFLSQVENDLTSPSIATLADICNALGISLAMLFSEDVQEQVVFRQDDYIVDTKNNLTTTWIVPNAQKNKMEPIIITLEADSQSKTILPFEGEAFGYVLQGRVTLVINQQMKMLKKGETFYLTGRYEHYLLNSYQQVAKVLWVLTPPNF